MEEAEPEPEHHQEHGLGFAKKKRNQKADFYSFLFTSPIYLDLFLNLCFLLNTSNVQQRDGFEEVKTKTMTKGQCT